MIVGAIEPGGHAVRLVARRLDVRGFELGERLGELLRQAETAVLLRRRRSAW